MEKLKNQYTINFNDDYKKIIDALASAYNRKPAEMLRLLLIPALHDAYASIELHNNPDIKPVFIKL